MASGPASMTGERCWGAGHPVAATVGCLAGWLRRVDQHRRMLLVVGPPPRASVAALQVQPHCLLACQPQRFSCIAPSIASLQLQAALPAALPPAGMPATAAWRRGVLTACSTTL